MFKRDNTPTWICAIITLWQVIQQNIWRRQDLKQPTAGTHELEFWISNGLLIAGLIGAILFNLKAARSSPRPAGGLVVRSAYYGIGGPWWQWWKYKNVTDIARACERDNSIDIAVSNNIFGDPFKGDPKHLLVRYSYNGLHEQAVIPEGRYFTVPAKTKPADNTKDIDDMIFQRIRSKYINLPWQQKYALKRIWSRRALPISELALGLENCNFTDPKTKMIRPLLEDSVLVETNRPHAAIDDQLQSAATEIFIKSTEVFRILSELFKESLC